MKDFDIRQIQPGVAPKDTNRTTAKEHTGSPEFDNQLQSELQSTVKDMGEISTQAKALASDDVSATRDMAQRLLEQANDLAKMYHRLTGKEQKS